MNARNPKATRVSFTRGHFHIPWWGTNWWFSLEGLQMDPQEHMWPCPEAKSIMHHQCTTGAGAQIKIRDTGPCSDQQTSLSLAKFIPKTLIFLLLMKSWRNGEEHRAKRAATPTEGKGYFFPSSHLLELNINGVVMS